MNWNTLLFFTVGLVAIFVGCARVGLVRKGMQVHGLLWKMNFGFDVLLQNSLIGFFVRYGCVELARQVFDRGVKVKLCWCC